MTKSDFLLSVNVKVSCNVPHAGPSSLVVFAGSSKILLGDLQIQISKNGLQLKLKLHKIWKTEL